MILLDNDPTDGNVTDEMRDANGRPDVERTNSTTPSAVSNRHVEGFQQSNRTQRDATCHQAFVPTLQSLNDEYGVASADPVDGHSRILV